MRRVLVLTHTGRKEAVDAARKVVHLLEAQGLEPVLLDDEAADIPDCTGVQRVRPGHLDGLELVVVLGGDGTVLRGAELVHGTSVPLLGVNLGRVGFLAETERDALESTVAHVAARDYSVEERLTLEVDVIEGGAVRARSWALNDVSVEKGARERVLELVIEVDGRPVSTYGCDGVVMATPTGSTAYAFSAGGPVVWPGVQALLMVPVSAHALFARPLVVSPDSVMAVEVLERNHTDGVVWCDGRRAVPIHPGARIEVRRGAEPVRLAHITTGPFTDRLVAKFGLAVGGWRGPEDGPPHPAPASSRLPRPPHGPSSTPATGPASGGG